MPHSKTWHSHLLHVLKHVMCSLPIITFERPPQLAMNPSWISFVKWKTSDLWSNIKLSPWRVRIGSLLIFWCVTFVVPHIPDRFNWRSVVLEEHVDSDRLLLFSLSVQRCNCSICDNISTLGSKTQCASLEEYEPTEQEILDYSEWCFVRVTIQ